MTRWWTVLRCLTLVGCAAGADVDSDSADVTSNAPSTAAHEDYDTWVSTLSAKGIAISTTTPTLVGVRSPNTRVAQKFDDKMVLLGLDHVATSFAASTHPWFERNAAAPDVDHDGKPDVGMLAPGTFHATLAGSTYGAPKFAVALHNGSGSLPGWRNTNGDDQYEPSEIAASEQRGDLLTAILVHAAGPGSIAPIGCQVMAPADVNAVAKIVGKSFDYVLIDAD